METQPHVLPDLLCTGLSAVICGTAAGARSAAVATYYADPRNCFWKVLHQIGITPYLLATHEFSKLTQFGIGLTDIAKLVSGNDSSLPLGSYNLHAFREKIRHAQPEIVAFNGKEAARAFYGVRKRAEMDFGLKPQKSEFPKIFVLPSTSGSACAHWKLQPWQEFASLVKESRGEALKR